MWLVLVNWVAAWAGTAEDLTGAIVALPDHSARIEWIGDQLLAADADTLPRLSNALTVVTLLNTHGRTDAFIVAVVNP